MALLATLAIDPRPTVFGNKAVITGTLTAAGATSGHIDFSGLLASIDSFTINGTGGTVRAATSDSIDGSTVNLGAVVSGADYKFMAIGNRS